MSSESSDIVYQVDLNVLHTTISNIRRGTVGGLNQKLRESAQNLDEDADREQIRQWIQSLEPGNQTEIERHIKRRNRVQLLRAHDSRLSIIPHLELDSAADVDKNINSAATQLSDRETAYFDSHFKFTNSSSYLYEIEGLNGILNGFDEEELSEKDALKILCERIKERGDISDLYAEAATSLSPIVGELKDSPLPRLIYLEDEDHLYIEFWSLKQPEEVFDGKNGYSISYRPRARSAARIHMDTNTIEIFDGKKSENHRNTIREQIERLCNDEQAVTDGGTGKTLPLQIVRQKSLSEDDLWDSIDELAALVSLENFEGNTADVRLSSVKDKDVQEDDSHEELSERPLRVVNMRLLFDDWNGTCQFIPPDEIFSNISYHRDDSLEDIKGKITESELNYDNISHITLTLNSEGRKIRVQKPNANPQSRQALFHLVADALNW